MSHPFDRAIEQLIAARKAIGLSQFEVEQRIGCSERMVGKWEARRRTPSLPSLVDWAKVLGHEVVLGGTAGPILEKATKHHETLTELHEAGLEVKLNPVLGGQDRAGLTALRNAESLLVQTLNTVRLMLGQQSST